MRRVDEASHFNPRSPHGERRETNGDKGYLARISIHAPRTGSDRIKPLHRVGVEISIHAPRTGSDRREGGKRGNREDFNPRSPHGERPLEVYGWCSGGGISIHAPRTGSDSCFCRYMGRVYNFNPRSPHGERLCNAVYFQCAWNFNPRSPHGERHAVPQLFRFRRISIHAPRTGSDE